MKQLFFFSAIIISLIFLCESCQKEIYFENAYPDADSLQTNPGAGNSNGSSTLFVNSWRFKDLTDGSVHAGIVDPLSTGFDIYPSWNYLKITGWPLNRAAVSKDTIFLITLFLPNPRIDTGSYPIGSGTGGDNFFGFANKAILPPFGSNQNFCYYIATADITQNFSVHIDSVDHQQKLIKGSFFGELKRRVNITDLGGNDHIISGAFSVRLN